MSLAADLVVREIGRLVTCEPKLGEGPLGVIEDAALAANQGRVVWIGPDRELHLNVEATDAAEVEAGGRALLPGLVDCHTHLVFAGNRGPEFAARMRGESYRTGGVLTTVAATREAPDDQLRRLARRRLDRFLAHGVTTVEIKSGYGLNVDQEARLVEVASTLGHPIDVVTTVLGAHVIPAEARSSPDRYVDQVVAFLLPRVRGRAEFCDVWCDEGAYSVAQSRRVLEAARMLGFKLKVHAEQLGHIGGAALAAELGATSVDHLEHATEEDADLLGRAGTIAVLLPGASMMTRSRFAPATMLIERGVRVALSTDCNPGTSFSENLQLTVALACAHLGMTVEEAILGVTRHAAAAVDREGSAGCLRPGVNCDAVLLDASHEVDLAYHYGVNLTATVIKRGKVFVPGGLSDA
jgi:imidazolonepropionase